MARIRIGSKKLSSFLKIDCFGETQKIRFAGDLVDQDIVSRPDFFKHLFVEVRNGKIPIRFGTQQEYKDYNYKQWINDLQNDLYSVVVFIEGYAGCGKSVFVQEILRNVFPDMDYDRNYYNYDIGFTFEHNNQDRIKDAILECFIDQYVCFFKNNQIDIISQMERLLEQEEISKLDNGRNIFYEFTATKAYSYAKKLLFEHNDVTNFKKEIHDQLKKLQSEQVIYIDCILRLAKYIICEDEPEAQIICYDNLDAIENNIELCNFDNVLVAVRENMDSYLSKTGINYSKRGVPHFVFIATFRKITAARVGLYDGSERFGDNRRQIEKVCFIDGSHLFEYKQMVENRYKYMKMYSDNHSLGAEIGKTIKQMKEVVQLFDTYFVKARFAGLWNNNYRTCSDIMECIIDKYEDEVVSCIELTKQKYDTYDGRINVAGGASAIFLSIICKVQRDCDYWGKLHLSINELNNKIPTITDLEESKDLIKDLTTLSRLLLTYINNVALIEHRHVSTRELYGVFRGVYSVDDIARSLANMLTHDRKGIWRRPIVYTRNVIPDGQDVFEELRNQGEIVKQSKNLDEYQFTEITTCECGESFVTQVSCDFEYYSVRLGHDKSLYLVKSFREINTIIADVYQAVSNCCMKMMVFKDYYCSKKKMSEKYFDQLFHPRTFSEKAQLHTERVIFNHIEYLDNYRYYIAHSSKDFTPSEKVKIRNIILNAINQYFNLYSDIILKIDRRRSIVYDELVIQYRIVYSNPNDINTRIKRIREFR